MGQAINDLHLKIVSGKPLYVGLAEKRSERQQRLNARFRNPGQFGNGGPGMGGMNGGMNQGGPMYYSGGQGGMRPNMMNNPMMMQGMNGGWGQQPGMRPNMMMGGPGGMRPPM